MSSGQLLEPFEPLDVRLQRLSPGAGPAAGHRVGGLGQHSLDGPDLDLVVVCLDGVHDVLVLAAPPGDLRADDGVAAFDFMRQRLADVVQGERTA